MLVANKFLAKAGDDLSDKHPGDPVPEAAKWPNLRMYLAHKWIVEIPDAPQQIDTGSAATVGPTPPVLADAVLPVPQFSTVLESAPTSGGPAPAASDLQNAEPSIFSSVDPVAMPEAAPTPKRRGRWKK